MKLNGKQKLHLKSQTLRNQTKGIRWVGPGARLTHGDQGRDEVELRVGAGEVVDLGHETLFRKTCCDEKIPKLILGFPEKNQ